MIGLARRAGKIVFGETMFKSFSKHLVQYIVIANDISERSYHQIQKKASYYQIEFIQCLDSEILSKAIGKDNIKAIGITDIQFKEKIKNIIREGGK